MQDTSSRYYQPTKTTETMTLLNDIIYLCGLRYFWVVPERFSQKFVKIYNVISNALHVISCGYTMLLLASFITQTKLTTKQRADMYVVNLANPITHLYCGVFIYHRKKVKQILSTLMVELKREQNEELVEMQMLRKLILYLVAYFGSGYSTILFYGAFGIYQKIQQGTPFVTVVTAWPDVEDLSVNAELARFIFYFFWWISFPRVSSCYIILLSMLIGLSKQYANLQCYFINLNKIFSSSLSQRKKEEKYELDFVKGVQMYSKTIWCVNKMQHVCRSIFSIQMLLALIIFISLLPVLLGRDISSAVAIIPTVMTSLVSLGFFMWNAGDISVEASILPDAIYCSGWHHCCYRSKNIRKLVFIAIAQAQKPVILKGLGVIELSYNSYLNVIKTAHSIVSVFL